MSKCPNCGGELTYNVGDTQVVCPYCKSTFNPEELKTKTKFSAERETFEGKSFNCKQCGAILLTFDETAITFCSYCGSQNVIESKMVKVNNPDYVIPFKITKEECIKRYKNHLKKALFVPKYLKEDVTVEKFRGIFMPYNIYKTEIHGNVSNSGERYSHRSGDYIIYDKFDVIARVDAEYEGVSFDLLSKFYDSYSMSIPFDYSGILPFNKNYLIGFYADMKDVEGHIYDDNVERITSNDTTKYLDRRHEYRRFGVSRPKASLKVTERKTGMFPVYFLATKDKKGELHYAVINGQTGKIAADLPIDFKKFIFGTLIIAAIIFALLHFGSVILPKVVLIFSMISAIISMIISISQLRKVFDKEYHLDDEGYLFTNNSDIQTITKQKQTTLKPKDSNGVRFGTTLFAIFIFFGMSVGGGFLSQYFNILSPSMMIAILVPIGLLLISIFNHHSNNKNNKEKIDAYKDGKKLKKVKMGDLAFQILSLVIGIVVLLSGTIKDEVYYISSFIIFVLILLSFKDLIKEHNILSSNKPPQLEKRGGDEK